MRCSPFLRSYDDITVSDKNSGNPATISSFRLDQYEVTVGRFRQFVNAVIGGYTPAVGSGKHSYLNGTAGLTAVSGVGIDAGANEPGWQTPSTAMPTDLNTWTSNLGCFQSTWTQNVGSQENLPVNCVTWPEAYAFCIWDGGFLPSEAEWNYAAAGGAAPAPPSLSFGVTGQRVYPWANNVGPSNDAGMAIGAPNNIDCTFANFSGCVGQPSPVGSYSLKGDGKFGQADLAGNVSEWVLDSTGTTPTPYEGTSGSTCVDCANVSTLPNRIARGGSFNIVAGSLYTSYRFSYPVDNRDGAVGMRCARAP